MSGVTGALEKLAPKLLQLLHDEYKLQKDVRKQVESLSDELNSIYAFLCKVSDVPWDRLDEQVKMWAREVREASYDMEDIIDSFLVRVDSGKNNADSSSLKLAMTNLGELFRKAKARHDIAGEIKDITKHLQGVAERRQKYKLDEIMSKPATSIIDPRLKAMYKEATELIAVNKSGDKLISLLNASQPDDDASNKKMKKVSIVGVGGLGKTTLAKVVYDKLMSQYVCGAFVSVGRDYDPVKVFKDILYQLNKKKYENIHNTGRGVELLIDDLRAFLKNKRYFIVIDDVWEVKTWEIIKLALVENNYGSKVITTTRNSIVAEEAGEVYKLKPLSNDDSMKLFYTRIYGASGKHLHNLPDDISHKIIKKCAGIPLAIITMSSLLASKPDCEWSKVYNSISFDTKGNRESEDTMTILSFSYYDLPPHLRTCLLYLSTYPEDYDIGKISLIWKWIAEGFIIGDQGTRLFELGEIYFNDLINRSLIQLQETYDGRVSSCRVHDMVLDLMRKISSEEKFIAILGYNVEGTLALVSKVRRLANQNRISHHIISEAMVTGMPKVRSYTSFMCFIDRRDQFLRFKLLRVLDIVSCKFKKGCRLDHLGDLFHLRYLGIRCEGIDGPELPKQIGNLRLLQTLDVDATLPESIVRLTELVRLYAYRKVPDGIAKLVSLEELIIINGCSDKPNRFLKELGSLRELRVLKFSTDGMDESMQRHFVVSLCNLQKIQYLVVQGSAWDMDTAMLEAAGFVLPRPLRHLGWSLIKLSKFPSCINHSLLPNLSHLELCAATMDEQDLKILAMLPALCYLYLETRSTVTVSNITAGDRCFFQNLRYFGVNAMVQFEQQHNEMDTSISFHIWNGEGDMPFGYLKYNDSGKVVPCGMMPNVEILRLCVTNGHYRNIGLKYLPSIRKVQGVISRMSTEDMDAAFDSLRNECEIHPNHPTMNMNRLGESKQKDSNNVSKDDEENEKQTVDVDAGKLSLSTT